MGDAVLAAVIGLVSGILSGAFGIGGGIITTPAIALIMKAPALMAVGTPLPVILPASITGAVSYARHGLANVRTGLLLGLTGSITSVLGAYLAARTGGTIVLIGTAMLIFYAAGDTVAQIVRPVRPESQEEPIAHPVWMFPLIGTATGLFSGFFGLGGGFILIPMLTRFGRYSLKKAVATSLVAVAVLSVPGTIAHSYLGNIDWGIALAMIVGVTPGAMVGAKISLGTADKYMRVAFAVVLLVAGGWLLIEQIGNL